MLDTRKRSRTYESSPDTASSVPPKRPKHVLSCEQPSDSEPKVHPFFAPKPGTKSKVDIKKNPIWPSDTKSRVAKTAEKKSRVAKTAEKKLASASEQKKILLAEGERKSASRKAVDEAKAAILAEKGLPKDFIEEKMREGGVSRSSTYARKARIEIQMGVHQPEPKRMANFRNKCIVWDPDVQLDPDHPNKAQCSRCLTWVALKDKYHLQRFREHRQHGCKEAPTPEAGARTLFDFSMTSNPGPGLVQTQRLRPSPPKCVTKICPGITAAYDRRIEQYLHSVGVTGGGS